MTMRLVAVTDSAPNVPRHTLAEESYFQDWMVRPGGLTVTEVTVAPPPVVPAGAKSKSAGGGRRPEANRRTLLVATERLCGASLVGSIGKRSELGGGDTG